MELCARSDQEKLVQQAALTHPTHSKTQTIFTVYAHRLHLPSGLDKKKYAPFPSSYAVFCGGMHVNLIIYPMRRPSAQPYCSIKTELYRAANYSATSII